jgi:hypothetical protein
MPISTPQQSPYTAIRLDLLRIVVSVFLIITPEVWSAYTAFQSPPSGKIPWGFEWIVESIGFHQEFALLSLVFVYGGALLGVIGHWSRIGLAISSIGLYYLVGRLQMQGAPVHMHHLLWFSVALVFSPCTDVLRLGHRPTYAHGRKYKMPLLILWGIIALIFFFPGWHKMTLGGSPWFSGETLYHTVLWKQQQYWDQNISVSFSQREPYAVLSWIVIIFELGAPLILLWWKRTGLFLILALGFHLGTALMLNIHFTNLWPCYVVLVPWERWISSSQPQNLRTRYWTLYPLLFGIVLAGVLRKTDGWPFACYPTFHQQIDSKMPLLSAMVLNANGDTRRIDHQQYIAPTNSSWGKNWRAAGLFGKVEQSTIQEYARQHIIPLTTQKEETIYLYQSKIDVRTSEITDLRLLLEWSFRN